MAVAMASYVTPLFVQVSPANTFAEKVETNLEIYFQSPKKSGGGECNVRVENRERGIYSVRFWSEEGILGSEKGSDPAGFMGISGDFWPIVAMEINFTVVWEG